MAWLTALAAALAGYFFFLVNLVRLKVKSRSVQGKFTLILLFRNVEHSVERIMWDLFRLQTWWDFDFNFIIVDGGSEDDTLKILQVLNKRYRFMLMSLSYEQGQKMKKRFYAQNCRLLDISGPEHFRLTRRRIVAVLNEGRYQRKRKAGSY